jgi:hypothetical protein
MKREGVRTARRNAKDIKHVANTVKTGNDGNIEKGWPLFDPEEQTASEEMVRQNFRGTHREQVWNPLTG